MRHDLASLMCLFATEEDYVYSPSEDGYSAELLNYKGEKLSAPYTHLPQLELTLWALDPHTVKSLEQWANKVGIRLLSPTITDRYLELSHRQSARDLLQSLTRAYPNVFSGDDILPHWIYPEDADTVTVDELLELFNTIKAHSPDGCLMLKRPFTSSGRGVMTITPPLDEEKAKWVKEQLGTYGISIEPKLNRLQDYALILEVRDTEVIIVGYSLFYTDNQRGVSYSGSLLRDSEALRTEMLNAIGCPHPIWSEIEEFIRGYLAERLIGHYRGFLGIDMLLYRNLQGETKLNPVVEINLRASMGLIALQLSKLHLPKGGTRSFHIDHLDRVWSIKVIDTRQDNYLSKLNEHGEVGCSYLPLTEINPETEFHAYLMGVNISN